MWEDDDDFNERPWFRSNLVLKKSVMLQEQSYMKSYIALMIFGGHSAWPFTKRSCKNYDRL